MTPSNSSAPGDQPGAEARLSEHLTDPDIVDEHRIRRSRLSAALCRGASGPRHAPVWRAAAAGLVLTALALGGTAVAATVHRHIPSFGGGVASHTDPTSTPESIVPTRTFPEPRQSPAFVPSATEGSHPYGGWYEPQSSDHTAR